MKLAFCLFNYFPYGGLQRDFLRIARVCRDRGHTIHVYTMRWEGEREPGIELHCLPSRGLQNHTRCRVFVEALALELKANHYDLTIGFNKMPHLDLYYAADVCYQARERKQHGWWYRLSSRYRQWVAFEEAVFHRTHPTEIMLISPRQAAEYQTYYHTPSERFHELPPGIARDYRAPPRAAEMRATVRAAEGLPADHDLLLMVGSGFKTKGLDRVIHSVAALPETLKKHCQLWVVGQDDPTSFMAQARQCGIIDRVRFFGGRSDVSHFMLAADVLVHPARHENTGTVLLEAIVSGLPVLTVDVCGYAPYVITAKAGRVLSSPFNQAEWNMALQNMLLSPDRPLWRQHGFAFAEVADIYSLPEKAADLIDHIGAKRA